MAEKPFNELTPAEVERLSMLAEEAGEVVKAVGKILRHGYGSCHPVTKVHNGCALGEEIEDFFRVASHLKACGDVDFAETVFDDGLGKKAKYMHHLHDETGCD